jgi:hypothetical protein
MAPHGAGRRVGMAGQSRTPDEHDAILIIVRLLVHILCAVRVLFAIRALEEGSLKVS